MLTVAALAVLISLGNWQLRRLAWKEDLIARVSERPSSPVSGLPPAAAWSGFDVTANEYRPFWMRGHFLHEREALVFTSLPDAKGRFSGPGYWVVTPFSLELGGTVFVNRGFAPQDRFRAADRGEALTAATVEVTGLLRPDEDRNFFTPDDQPDANIFFARNIATLAAAKAIPEPVAPFTIDLTAAATPPAGLPQAGETRMTFTNNHLAYAVTWYGLGAALLSVFVSFAWTRLRSGATGATGPA